MLSNTFGLPVFEVADEIVKVIEQSQKANVQHWEKVLLSVVEEFLSDANYINWYTVNSTSDRESTSIGFKVPYDFDCIPDEQRDHILSNVTRRFTNTNKTHVVDLYFLTHEKVICVQLSPA